MRGRSNSWAAGDSRARGFLLGGTAGRTTLNGEGLQHEDGHSHVLASVVPNCVSYDPTFSYEVAVIIQDGLRRMFGDQEDVFFYLTLMNENYEHPALPEGAEAGILRGMYLLREGSGASGAPSVQLLGSGTILREVIAAGAGVKSEEGKLTPLDVKAGDRILFGKWSGTEVKIDGEDLLIMKESDILGIIEGSTSSKKKAAE